MKFIKDYKDIKDKIRYINRYKCLIQDKNGKEILVFRNINQDFFQFDYDITKLQESQDFFYELRFDFEVKGIFKTSFEDKKKELTSIIIFEENEGREISDVFDFNVEKIYSFNDFFQVNKQGKTYYNDLRDKYRKEIENEYKRHKVIENFLRFERIQIELDFIINYSQKDIDNITKPFIDILYSCAGLKNDNNVCRLITTKHKNYESNDESIYVKISKFITKDYRFSLRDEFRALKC